VGKAPQTPKKRAQKKGVAVPKIIRKTLRFSVEEFAKIEQIIDEHKLTFSDFSRSAILKKKVNSKLRVDMIYQIQRVGNNLNQIAKVLNQKKSEISNIEIMRKLIDIENSIKEFSDDR